MALHAKFPDECANPMPHDFPPQGSHSERKRNDTTLCVIVPAYNEEYLIGASLARLNVLGDAEILKRVTVIVVDDGSTDHTPQEIERFRADLEQKGAENSIRWIWLRHETNLGKGTAIRTALPYVDTELLVVHDADLEYHPRDLLRMAEVFLCEDADAVFGSRFMAGGYKRALFFRHSLGNKLLTFLCDVVCDLNLTDMETCYKMVRADLLKTIPIESSTFDVEPELTIKLAKRGSRIFEVPINYSGRTYKEGKKITWRDGSRALWAILRHAASDRIYTQDEWGSEALERLNRAPRFNQWMADAIRPYLGERVLEIGAGIGKMSQHLMPRALYWATDVNPLYVDSLAKLRTNRPYMHAAYADAAAAETLPDEQTFDTVVCLNVVEHLQDDVAALRNFHGTIEEGGRAIILVPNGPALYGSFDELLGHCRRYTRQQLAAVAEQAGFRVERMLSFNRPGTIAWWLNACVLKRRSFGRMQIASLNLLTPLFRILDPWLPLPPLSLIAILRKDTPSPANMAANTARPNEPRS
ncbi:MAG TPA: bifunctional glycosyltransferase/class I SAM-dependent methyltransferase [Candidatus Acidoferrales bacterium]|nr:bifunctional glycosyltransferase/class I SAM-dependent methyltransferase [Candidatus Acidoferrales bacterium]